RASSMVMGPPHSSPSAGSGHTIPATVHLRAEDQVLKTRRPRTDRLGLEVVTPPMAMAAPRAPEPTRRWAEGLGIRPELILVAATELFSERGFPAVGVDDIGRAAGITGPAVYRHFPSKVAILVALLDRISDRLVEGGEAQLSRGRSPRPLLERLVGFHIDHVLGERALIAVYLGEENSLPT